MQRGPPLVPVKLAGSGEECDKCPCGQQCLYIPGDRAEGRVAGSHITPVIRYRDDLFFQAIQGDENSCELFGHSHSTVGPQKQHLTLICWLVVKGPAWFDFTTNYCNLRNLMVGTGLAERPGYTEQSSTDLCMQFDRIEEFGNCNKY